MTKTKLIFTRIAFALTILISVSLAILIQLAQYYDKSKGGYLTEESVPNFVSAFSVLAIVAAVIWIFIEKKRKSK